MLSLRRVISNWLSPTGRAVYVPSADLFVPPALADWFMNYEPLTTAAFLEALKPGMAVLDVGAHIGYYTVQAAKRVGETGRVYAVEPSPNNRKLLEQNVRRFPQVEILPYAAGASNISRTFQIAASEDMDGFYGHPLSPTTKTIEVKQARLDSILGVHNIDAVKMDVEGAELEALEGMKEIFETSSPFLCIEWNPKCLRHAGVDPMRLLEELERLGFRSLQCIDDQARFSLPLGEALQIRRPQDDPEAFFNLVGWKDYY